MSRLVTEILPALALAVALAVAPAPAAAPVTAVTGDAVTGGPDVTGEAAATDVAWVEVEAAIARVVCVVTRTTKFGEESYAGSAGDRGACGALPAGTPLDRAVDAAFDGAAPLLPVLEPDLSGAFAPGLAPEERSRRAADAYLANKRFLRAIVPRVCAGLAAQGARCSGAPEFPPLERRAVAWHAFAPYVAALAWPEDVRTPLGADGQPSGPPRAVLAVARRSNGLAGIDEPDPELVRAAVVAVLGNRAFEEIARRHFDAALAEPGYARLATDARRTAYLRERVPAGTVADPEAKGRVCARLAAYSDDLGLDVDGCR